MKKVFYYHFDWLDGWFVFNSVLTIIIAYCALTCPCVFSYVQSYVIISVVILSDLLWIYKHCFRLQAVVIDDKSIKIDHNKPLKWQDIDYAEEKDILCCFKKRHIISLEPKENIEYRYNYLQKHNCFPPFSVPLYGILKPEDEEEIRKIITKKVKVKTL